jgi:hypothetical protein
MDLGKINKYPGLGFWRNGGSVLHKSRCAGFLLVAYIVRHYYQGISKNRYDSEFKSLGLIGFMELFKVKS